MNWYSLRKMIYGFLAGVATDGVVALGAYLSMTQYEGWFFRGIVTAVATAVVAGLRRRFLPGWLGSQN